MSQAVNLVSSQSADLRPLQTVKPRVSLVTGGTDGIGRATALELARGGDRVIFIGRNARRGAEVLAELRRVAPNADHEFLPADLSLMAATQHVSEKVEQLTSRLDAAVFCAGILSTVSRMDL